MKINVNLKVLEQSLKLASKAAELEREFQDSDLAQLLHEVNLMALGIPKVVSRQDEGVGSETGLDSIIATINEIKSKIAAVPQRSEAIFEFARLLDQESELVKHYHEGGKQVERPLKTSRLSLQDRGRVAKSLSVKVGFQTRLF